VRISRILSGLTCGYLKRPYGRSPIPPPQPTEIFLSGCGCTPKKSGPP
jgi:hypothetical protein